MRRDDKVGLLISVLGPRETQTGINVEVAGLGCWQTCDDTSAGSSQQRRLPAFAAFTLPNMAAIVAWETQRCGTGIAGGTLGERVTFGRMGVTETPAVVFSVQISMRGFSASRSGTGYRKLCRKFTSFSEPLPQSYQEDPLSSRCANTSALPAHSTLSVKSSQIHEQAREKFPHSLHKTTQRHYHTALTANANLFKIHPREPLRSHHSFTCTATYPNARPSMTIKP